MEFTISSGPSFAFLEVALGPGERIAAEGGAMAWMDETIQTETSVRGGFLKGLGRSALAKQSLFQNVFEARGGGGKIVFTPGQPGEITSVELEEGELFMEPGAWLAAEEGVTVSAAYQGLKGLFHEGLFVVKASGTGRVFFAAYGEAHPVDVDGFLRVDTGHAAAWEASLDWRLTRGGQKIRAFLFSDRLVTEFSGKGRVWVQSRSPQALANWIHPFRRVRHRNQNP